MSLTCLKDNRLSIDCLDGSDEIDITTVYSSIINIHCLIVATFRYQESTSRYGWSFPCDD
jgi:hypothetical protein